MTVSKPLSCTCARAQACSEDLELFFVEVIQVASVKHLKQDPTESYVFSSTYQVLNSSSMVVICGFKCGWVCVQMLSPRLLKSRRRDHLNVNEKPQLALNSTPST